MGSFSLHMLLYCAINYAPSTLPKQVASFTLLRVPPVPHTLSTFSKSSVLPFISVSWFQCHSLLGTVVLWYNLEPSRRYFQFYAYWSALLWLFGVSYTYTHLKNFSVSWKNVNGIVMSIALNLQSVLDNATISTILML